MNESHEEDPTVRVASGGPSRAARDGTALLAGACERTDRTRIVDRCEAGGADGPHVCATVEGQADGAADEPVGAVWKRAREADGDPVMVVRATGEQYDPASGIPGYKTASVCVRSLGADGGDR